MSCACDLCEVNVEGMISQEITECHLDVRRVKKMKGLQKRCLEPTELARGGSKGGARWARALPSKVSTLFFCCISACMVKSFNLVFVLHGMHACSARLTFDQRTVYVLSTARVSRSVSSESSARGMRDMTADRSI